MFVCPSCHSLLKNDGNNLKCSSKKCIYFNEGFLIKDNLPILIPFLNEEVIFNKKDFKKYSKLGINSRINNKKLKLLKKVAKFIEGNNKKTSKNYEYLASLVNSSSKILIVGGGTRGNGTNIFYKKCNSETVTIEVIDIYMSPNLTAIADAHCLPYRTGYFDIVIIQAVLEHVLNPNIVVNEIYRVLAKGGVVYAETPFLQSVHEGAYDFQRFSHSGHRWLFRNFEEIKSGYLNGGFSSIIFILSHVMSGLFRNKYIGTVIRLIMNRIARLLDHLLPDKVNFDIACGCFFIGKKRVFGKAKPLLIDKYYKGYQ